MDNGFRLATILGARPQFIKAAALSRRIIARNRSGERIEERIIHTGQHYDIDMSDVFFQELDIPQPHLRFSFQSGDRVRRFSEMMAGLGQCLREERPDAVLVFGDTDSTLAGALTATQLGIPVAHVEAGLRSFNRVMPEETNRVLTDHMSRFLFCPTQNAVDNLLAEGLGSERTARIRPESPEVLLVGDIQLEAVRHHGQISADRAKVMPRVRQFAEKTGGYILATVHRAENTNNRERLVMVVEAIESAAETLSVVLSLHPRTRERMKRFGLRFKSPGVLVLHPQGFYDMLELLRHSALVLTDSGGLQKEAFFFRRPCITLREETEWVELVKYGYNVVVGLDSRKVSLAVSAMLARTFDWDRNLYGDGTTSDAVLDTLAGVAG